MLASKKIALANIAVCLLATVVFYLALLSNYLPAQKDFEKRVQDIMSTPGFDRVGMSDLLKSHGISVTFTGAKQADGRSADDYITVANDFVGKPHLDLIFKIRLWVTCAAAAFVILNVVAFFRVRDRSPRAVS